MPKEPKIIIRPPNKQYCDNYTKIFGDKKVERCHIVYDKPSVKHNNAPYIKDYSWVPGIYHDIDVNPIKIESKAHLIHECEKRGLYSKAFMKRKSRGHGNEHRR